MNLVVKTLTGLASGNRLILWSNCRLGGIPGGKAKDGNSKTVRIASGRFNGNSKTVQPKPVGSSPAVALIQIILPHCAESRGLKMFGGRPPLP